MSEQTIDCFILPSEPLPLLLPKECVASVMAKPEIDAMVKAPASWMRGHVNWENQRLPVLSYPALHNPESDESKKRKPHLVVLNPIPNAARKTYSGLICYGDIQEVTLSPDLEFVDLPESVDKRYVDAIIKVGEKDFIIPKLAALGVAFSYF
jgi:hypothetical protein